MVKGNTGYWRTKDTIRAVRKVGNFWYLSWIFAVRPSTVLRCRCTLRYTIVKENLEIILMEVNQLI